MKNYQYDISKIIEEIKECCDRGNYYVALKEALDLAKSASVERYGDNNITTYIMWCDNYLKRYLLTEQVQMHIHFPHAVEREKSITWGCVIYKIFEMLNPNANMETGWDICIIPETEQISLCVDEREGSDLPTFILENQKEGYNDYTQYAFHVNIVKLIDHIIDATIQCMGDVGFDIEPFSIDLID